jgi:hypothetical protein
MENDSIRTSGRSTLVDIWIDGKVRAISVTREAIEAFLQLPAGQAATMSEDDRSEFVRTHLSTVITAATNRLRETDPGADSIVVDAGQLHPGRRASDRRAGSERRQGDRRQSDRRT